MYVFEIYIPLRYRAMFAYNLLFHPGIYYGNFLTFMNIAMSHPLYYYIALCCICICFQVTEPKYELTLTK